MVKIGFLILFISFTSNSLAIDGLLLKTNDYAFKEKWDNTLSASIPKITTCDTVFKKQYFYLTAIAIGYKLDKNEISDVQYSIRITKPDNSVYFNQENLPLVNGKILNPSNFQMSDAILKICFEDNDDFGIYNIQVEIFDKIDHKSKKIESEIVLAELPAYNQFIVKTENDFMKWIEKYYDNPKPESALSNYLYYSQSSLSDKESSFWPIFSFFLEIVKNNSYLLPEIINCYENQDLKTKIFLLYLLTYSNIATNDFFNSLSGDEKDTYLKIKDSPMPDIYGIITDPAQLDMLWSTFMASGSYKPILKLIQTLDYAKYQGDLDNFKRSKQTKDDRQKAINNAIYNSLVWSLQSNCNQHELVFSYCKWAYQYEKLTKIQRDELKRIVAK
jgi:hypothetical protein